MRRSNREINTFNLSMVDMISGALGAFLILTIILLPYFEKKVIERVAAPAPEAENTTERMSGRASDKQAEANQSRVKADELEYQLETARIQIEKLESKLQSAQQMTEAEKAELERLRAEAAALQKQLEDERNRFEELQKETDKAQQMLQDMDLLILIDNTGSMKPVLDDIKKNLVGLVDIMLHISESSRLGFIVYNDEDYSMDDSNPQAYEEMEESGLHNLDEKGQNILSSWIGQKDVLYGGLTWEESLHKAFDRAVESEWRSDVRRVIVVFADAAAKPEKVASTIQMAKEFSSESEGSMVSTIFIDHGYGWQEADSRFFSQLAAAGQGQFIQHGGNSLVSLLLSLF
jgi:adenylate kinase family enzyme